MGMTRPGSAATSRAVASRFSSLRLAITTCAPAAARRWVMALPMPRPPPVTRATLSFKAGLEFMAVMHTSVTLSSRKSHNHYRHFTFVLQPARNLWGYLRDFAQSGYNSLDDTTLLRECANGIQPAHENLCIVSLQRGDGAGEVSPPVTRDVFVPVLPVLAHPGRPGTESRQPSRCL